MSRKIADTTGWVTISRPTWRSVAASVTLSAEIALPFFRTDVRHDLKPDGSPVSEADLAVEHAVLDMLGRERPGDGVLSEECGGVARGAVRRRWLIDPIDGTVPFLAGNTGVGDPRRARDRRRNRVGRDHTAGRTSVVVGGKGSKVRGHRPVHACRSRRPRRSTTRPSAATRPRNRCGRDGSRRWRPGWTPTPQSSS